MERNFGKFLPFNISIKKSYAQIDFGLILILSNRVFKTAINSKSNQYDMNMILSNKVRRNILIDSKFYQYLLKIFIYAEILKFSI